MAEIAVAVLDGTLKIPAALLPSTVPAKQYVDDADAALQQQINTLGTSGGTLSDTYRRWPTVGGVYPPRPATNQVLVFSDPAVKPAPTGSLSGGGGGVPGHDLWINVSG